MSDYSFGWLNQESHLMSWALSCLSISKHYDVALYTDTEGKRMLVDRLKLPYKEVHVVYDDLAVLPHHWAIAKIKTYTLQVEPFIHVDGDIYIPNPLPDDILKAGLVAQNREIGTKYYRRMVDRMLSFGTIKLPRYIEQGLEEESISSYNMGIFGGNDVDFIHEYCDEAMRFVRDNDINNASLPHSRVVCNIFFEQIILAAFADLKKREVASVLGRDVKDEGYSGFEFCDLAYYEQRAFFHLLGGHKPQMAALERQIHMLFDVAHARQAGVMRHRVAHQFVVMRAGNPVDQHARDAAVFPERHKALDRRRRACRRTA